MCHSEKASKLFIAVCGIQRTVGWWEPAHARAPQGGACATLARRSCSAGVLRTGQGAAAPRGQSLVALRAVAPYRLVPPPRPIRHSVPFRMRMDCRVLVTE